MKKVLFVATVDSHIRHFHIPYLKYFHDKGYEVHVATSDDEGEKFDFCDVKHKITMERSPFKVNNIKAIGQMVELIKSEEFDIIHCHTPMGGVVTRLAVRKLRCGSLKKGHNSAQNAPDGENGVWSPNKMQVIYTAHGFHFYKGAPFINWAVYYPIEKWLSKYTDKLITINHEDYNLAVSKKFKVKKIYKINGVGVDAEKFNFYMSEEDKKRLKRELSSLNDSFKINKEDIVVTYVAELIPRKNQHMILEIMKSITEKDLNCKIKLLLVGTGKLMSEYEEKIKSYNLKSYVLIAGYRKDVPKLLKISDIAISCSRQEGLPFNLVEAQMSGLPCVATNCRGNNEVIDENETGYLIAKFDKDKFENKLLKLVNSETMRHRMGKNAIENSKKYKLSKILDEMKKIYEE
jgi:glycosyltransferase EpsD